MKKFLCVVLAAASSMLTCACADTDDGPRGATAYRSAYSFVYMFDEQGERVPLWGRMPEGPVSNSEVSYEDCTLTVGEKYLIHVVYVPGNGVNHPIIEHDAGEFCDVTMIYDEEYFLITENTERGVSWYDLECLKSGENIELSIHSEVTKNISYAHCGWYTNPTRVIVADIVK